MRASHTRTYLTIALLSLAAPALAVGVSGARYVHVTIPGDGKTLSLAEVQVFRGGKNIALGKPTVQSSTASKGDAERAVDGNTSGEWSKGSITHTVQDVSDPAWEVDLGRPTTIEKIVVWNRNGFEFRLNGAQVLVLDARRRVLAAGDVGKRAEPGANYVALRPQTSRKAVAKIRPNKGNKPARNKRAKRGRRQPAAPAEAGGSFGTATSLRMAIEDLTRSFGAQYPKGREFLKRLDALEPKLKAGEGKEEFTKLQREALLANPLLDFKQILLVQRNGWGTGLPANWQGNSSLKKSGYDNQVGLLTSLDGGDIKTVYKSPNGEFVGDIELHFDARKLMFSSIAKNNAWAVFEINIDGTGLRQVTPSNMPDVDFYEGMYLPDERIICNATTGYQGVPCVGGKAYVANLHIMDPDGTHIRRLTFEQDNNWGPTMMHNGRVLYLRWEYTDSAHYFSRVLMHMNPDGTDQKAFYGSNSYWPNSLFGARPVPESTTQFIGVISGHHGVKRMGELVLFDASRGRFEADGAVQRIPGHGKKVTAITKDRLVDGSWPKFLHPWPLSNKYFLTAMAPAQRARWGIYLVDIYDNLLLLKDLPGYSLYEPIPLRKTTRPLTLSDQVRPGAKQAAMLVMDVYSGPGLRGVPRGTVKNIRVYRYEYSLRNIGGHYNMGMEGPWDAHLILGTTPVEEDGSAMFYVPANTPVAFQPLDKDGKALQLMRSWTVGMPGEVASCVGCHEQQNTPPPNHSPLAAKRGPKQLVPWYGPARGFSFLREVQPVLDKYCVGCHNSSGTLPEGVTMRADLKKLPDFSDTSDQSHYPKSYLALHPYVRRNGPEGDYHLLTPLEFHANTSELVQLLAKGHHGVQLDHEAWDRLLTWIDLNVPAVGTWTERGARTEFVQRRKELAKLYAGITYDPEVIVDPYKRTEKFIAPKPYATPPKAPMVPGWPMSADAAKIRQGSAQPITLDLGNGVSMELVKIPAGSFPMGSNSETPVERPVSVVQIDRSFYMGTTEVTLKQYQQFEATHVNGIYDRHYKDQVNRGYVMDDPSFPVIRVTWKKAMAFCDWLSKKTGKKVTLPTEAQWEWACRAGADTPLWFGDLNADFSKYANLADVKMKELAVKGVNPKPIKNPPPLLDFEPKDVRFNDGVLHLAPVGKYQANPWGLHDMHGNVAEWTRSAYMPYPYRDDDGRNDLQREGKRVVRGGGWHDRQYRATSSYRLGFPAWQRVYNVGFRVIIEE